MSDPDILFPSSPFAIGDYSGSKQGVGAVDPTHAIASSYDRLEPLVTPQQIRDEFLFGIPLVSKFVNPSTGKYDVMSDSAIGKIIERAVSMVETMVGIDVFPVQRKEKHPFDRCLYESLGYFKLEHRPATSIDQMAVVPANNTDVYVVPIEWIESAYLDKGQINIIPLTIAFQNGGFIPSQSSGGAMFLAILGQKHWIPAFWQIIYTSGFKDGLIPRQVNELIGTIASIEILSMLAATWAGSTSHSLGYDSMNQSISTPGPQIFSVRIQDLMTKRDALIGKIKGKYGFKLYSGTL